MNTQVTEASLSALLNWGFFLEKLSHFCAGDPVAASRLPFRLEKRYLLCAALKLRAFR